jgi:Rrf2 family nitric oxide-sensitive transcriptional repressor
MRITNYTTYAIRTLMFAALNDDRLCQAQEVADAFGISKSHLVKCVHQLGQWGFLHCVRGRNGGFRLAKPAGQIKIGDVVRKTEDTLDLVECFNAETNSCPLISSCLLSRAMQRATAAFIAELDAISIDDVTRNRRALLDLLAVGPDTVRAAG